MKMFKNYVQLQFHDRNDKIKIAIALLTIYFYFELKFISILKTKYYVCQKFIRCRNNDKIDIDFLIELHNSRIEIALIH